MTDSISKTLYFKKLPTCISKVIEHILIDLATAVVLSENHWWDAGTIDVFE